MATTNSGRKKLAKKLATIIVTIIVCVLGVLFPEEGNSNDNGNRTQGSDVAHENYVTSVASESIDGELQVHMIECGQADSFLLKQGDVTMLVDCGTRGTGEDVVKYLQEQGVTKLDYVFGTHPHDDHMGGMYDVITNIEVRTIIIPKVKATDATTKWYQKLMTEIVEGKYEVQYLEEGNTYEFEIGDASVKAIRPDIDPEGEANNYSPIMKVSFGQMDMIMTGDAEKEVERAVVASGENLEAEILKVGHHGSDTSSSEEFLNAVNPQYALISCEVGNKYEHPTESTMEKLEERNIEVYRTDECGSVVVTITAKDVSFSCEPGDYLSGIELEEKKS